MSRDLKNLEKRLYSEDEHEVEEATTVLVNRYLKKRDEKLLDVLFAALPNVSDDALQLMLASLGTLGHLLQHRADAIVPFLHREEKWIVFDTITALRDIKGEAAEGGLATLADHEDLEIRAYALFVLNVLKQDRSREARTHTEPRLSSGGPPPFDHPMNLIGCDDLASRFPAVMSISRDEAAVIAEQRIRGNAFGWTVGSVKSLDELSSHWPIIYNVSNEQLYRSWIVYLEPPVLMVGGSMIVVVSRESGQVLYHGWDGGE